MSEPLQKSNGRQLDVAKIKLSFPCSAEYVSIARLAILGIASRMPLSYDEVEDVRLAVGEACTHAVERSAVARDGAPSNGGVGTIAINSEVSPSRLVIEVIDDVPVGAEGAGDAAGASEDFDIDRPGLGALLMEILVDEVEVRSGSQGTSVRLIKNAPAL